MSKSILRVNQSILWVKGKFCVGFWNQGNHLQDQPTIPITAIGLGVKPFLKLGEAYSFTKYIICKVYLADRLFVKLPEH